MRTPSSCNTTRDNSKDFTAQPRTTTPPYIVMCRLATAFSSVKTHRHMHCVRDHMHAKPPSMSEQMRSLASARSSGLPGSCLVLDQCGCKCVFISLGFKTQATWLRANKGTSPILERVWFADGLVPVMCDMCDMRVMTEMKQRQRHREFIQQKNKDNCGRWRSQNHQTRPSRSTSAENRGKNKMVPPIHAASEHSP